MVQSVLATWLGDATRSNGWILPAMLCGYCMHCWVDTVCIVGWILHVTLIDSLFIIEQ